MTESPQDWAALNAEANAVWDANAAFWDEQMGEGNDFQKLLVEPAVDTLLAPRAGMRVLELACGNGLYSRHLAGLGCDVLATDASTAMLELAAARTASGAVTYRQADVTDRQSLRALGPGPFDAAVCNMALMDIADIDPVFEVLPELLVPGAPFIFAVMHPCFNGMSIAISAERSETETGDLVTSYALKVPAYHSQRPRRGIAMMGQPEVQWYFHRTLSRLFGAAFAAGWVLDGLEEPVFPDGHAPRHPGPSWANLPDIPPVMAVRVRQPGARSA